MAEIMPLIGDRIWRCYYAGGAQNRALARFQLSEAVNLMEKGAILRPKYVDNMEKFISGCVAEVKRCIESADWQGFESAFAFRDDGRTGQRQPRVLRQVVPALQDP
jgi:hypothetical protein